MSELPLDGHVAVVTGTTSGVGRATARKLASLGANVVGVARRAEKNVEPIVPDASVGSYLHIVGDASEPETAKQVHDEVIARYGRIDVVVNNAGIGRYADMTDTDVALFDEVMAANVRSTYLFTRVFVDDMIREGRGLFVTVSSQAGLDGYAGEAIYCATKHAQVGFTRALRKELRPHGIKVALLCPAGIETSFAIGYGRTDKGIAKANYLTSEDVANTVAFAALQSPNSNILEIGLASMHEG